MITINEVEEVIRRMGKPEEIFADEKHEEYQEQENNHEKGTAQAKKRLMRDPDNRILGGVAGGFAAYMDWDPTLVRIGLFLLMFFYGIMIPIYFLLWIIVPLAKTATDKLEMRGENITVENIGDKLEMRGENITVENIGKTVTDGFERVSNNINDYVKSGQPRTFLQKAADLFVVIIGFLLKFIIVLAGIVLLPPLAFVVFILIVILFALITGGAGILYHVSPFGMDLYNGIPTPMVIMGCLGTILLIGIPVFSLAYAICAHLFKWSPLSTPVKWVLIVLWIISLILCGIYVNHTGMLWDWQNYWQGNHYWNNNFIWAP